MNNRDRCVYPDALLSRRGAITRSGWGIAAVLAFGPSMACSQPQKTAADTDNDDDALLEQILTGPQPLIPRRQRPYRITRTLPISAGHTVMIEADAHIVWAGPAQTKDGMAAVFEAMGDNTGLVVAGDGVAYVACDTPSFTVYAAVMRGRRGFAVLGIQAVNCQHVYVGSSAPDYASVRTGPSGNIAHDVRIARGGARFASLPAANGNGAVMLSYVENAHVADVRYENVTSGVQWWGGDAGMEHWQNGARVNERKCSNLLIERVTVQHARIGGVWGSMGRTVTVRDCSVEECLDVGYDAEGCNAVTFERCTARNGHNGCFTTFALCDDIRFVDCRGSVDHKTYPLFRIYNVTQSNADNRSVTVSGGRFECLDPTGPSTMDTSMGPVRELTITHATLTNVRIDTAFFNMHHTTITNNVLTFPSSLGAGSAIRVGSSKGFATNPGAVVIQNNEIRYTAASPQGAATAIVIREDDFNANAVDKVIGNIISGPFAIGLALTNATANIGIVPSFEISGNRFQQLAPTAQLLATDRQGPGRLPAVQWDHRQTHNGWAASINEAMKRN